MGPTKVLLNRGNISLYVVALGEKEGLEVPISGISSPFYSNGYVSKDLALTDSEHFGTACWTRSLSRRSTIPHGYGL